ncbi:MAG: PfkB family carbohydrate kinase [Actinomycetaceae bacterium]|nr:PfkB family carbohydrate kinase [Actinomycetaceae bacterium]
MQAVFVGITTLDVAQLVSEAVAENRKVTSLAQLICAGGPATNAAVTFAALEAKQPQNRADSEASAKVRACVETVLVSALGQGKTAELIAADLRETGVTVRDCGDYSQAEDAGWGSETTPADFSASVSTIFVNAANGSRTLASTNSRLPLSPQMVPEIVEKQPVCVMLVNGHNPDLAVAALQASVPKSASETSDPFEKLEAKPGFLRILDGGSWKPWLPAILPYIDVAVISADFVSPLGGAVEETVEFLRGFGITKVIQTNGAEPVRWWWEGTSGEVAVPEVPAVCTLGAGDVFHGAFAWYCADIFAGGSGSVTAEQAEVGIEFAARVAATSVQSFGTREFLKQL